EKTYCRRSCFGNTVNKGCGAKRQASSNKDAFLKIAFHIFKKRGLIVEETALGTLFIRKKRL
ncbi:hypothetical protein, partial [Enterococcus thailandicus]|uniref:hypothetical protein n=1 Tax=Enterococcus thailandicus TaxID=417368 RepID=UPI0035E1F4C2